MYARVARRQNLPVMSDVILRVSNVRRSHLLASPKRCRFADVRGKSEILSGQVSRRSCATAEDEEARSLLVEDPEVEECVISFDLSAASVLVLTAPSGFGKSTLLKALAGLVPIDGGVGSSVLLRDESCSGLVPAVRGGLSEWRSRVRYVPAGGGSGTIQGEHAEKDARAHRQVPQPEYKSEPLSLLERLSRDSSEPRLSGFEHAKGSLPS